MDKTIDRFSPLVACIVHSDIIRVSPQKSNYQVSFSSIPPGLISKVLVSSATGSYLHVLGDNQEEW